MEYLWTTVMHETTTHPFSYEARAKVVDVGCICDCLTLTGEQAPWL